MDARRRQLQLHRFEPRTIRDYSTCLFTGGRRTGKSFLARDFLWHISDRIYDATAFTGTHEDEFPLERYFGEDGVVRGFDEERLSEFTDTQDRRQEAVAAYNARTGSAVECPQGLVYFEDLEYLKKKIWSYEQVRVLWFNGRHHRTMAFCLFQYLMEIPLALRGMFDYAAFTLEPNISVRERIWKQYGGACPTFRLFDTIFTECTRDYGALVVDCRTRSYALEDAFFWYRAVDHGSFRVGFKNAGGGPARVSTPHADDDMVIEF